MSTTTIKTNYNVYRPNDARWIAPYQSSQLMAGLTSTLGNNYQIVLGFDLSGLSTAVINSASLKIYRFSDDQGGAKTWQVEVASAVNSNGTVNAVSGTQSSMSVAIGTWNSVTLTSAQISALRTYGYIHLWGAYNGSYAAIRPKEYSSAAYAAYLSIDYTTEPDPQPPTPGTPSTVTTDTKSVTWTAGSDRIYSSSQLYYDIRLSTDGGSTWGSVITTGQGGTSYTLGIRSYLGQSSGQYFYTASAKIAVRTKTPAYNGTQYTSDWAYSGTFTINYRVTPTAPGLSLNKSSVYEGESLSCTFTRPAQYNAYDSDGTVMNLTYYARLLTNTALGQTAAPVTTASPSVTVTVPQVATAKADVATSAYAYCKDEQNQTSPGSSNVSVTVKRFRKPVIVLSGVERGQTSATVTFLISDTGFGASQLASQIGSVQYSLGGGAYQSVTLNAWNGLYHSFSLSGLDANTKYTISLKAVNVAPVAGLSNLTSDVYTGQINQYQPSTFLHSGGLDTMGLYVGGDFTQEAGAGCVKVENDVLDSNNGGSYITFKGAYHYSSGYLVRTNIPSDSNSMIQFLIIGNGYSSGNCLLISGNCYLYNSGNSILHPNAVAADWNSSIYVFCYDGYFHMWVAQTASYQSLSFHIARTNSNGAFNRVVSITNSIKPTSGVTREQAITIKRMYNSSNRISAGNFWDKLPWIDSAGVMEIGKFIDFHNSDSDTNDYTFRVYNSSDGYLYFTGPIRINGTGDAALGSTGHGFQVGVSSSSNIIMDNNEIMARNNGAATTLHLNADGGEVTVNNSASGGVVYHGGNRVIATNHSLVANTNFSVSGSAGDTFHFHWSGTTSVGDVLMYVNGNTTAGNYLKSYSYAGSASNYNSATIVTYANSTSYPCAAEGHITISNGRIWFYGHSQRGTNTGGYFSHSIAGTSLSSIRLTAAGVLQLRKV